MKAMLLFSYVLLSAFLAREVSLAVTALAEVITSIYSEIKLVSFVLTFSYVKFSRKTSIEVVLGLSIVAQYPPSRSFLVYNIYLLRTKSTSSRV